MDNKGFYCEICGAINNAEQHCKHHPPIKAKAPKTFEEILKIIKHYENSKS